jgi:exonuclease SbcC
MRRASTETLPSVILSLTLTDFMAHTGTTLALAPGLNVLCGPNNIGKSAVVEALRCLAQNPAPRHVIRHGASEARVTAELDNGWRVAWVRRKNYALYEVTPPGETEPQVFAKLGKGRVPAEVAELLRLSPVYFEKGEKGESVDVHLGDQRHPIFLLDQPGSMLADFLASSTESAHLMAMQDLLREKVRRARSEVRSLEEGTARAERGLDRLERLPELSLALEALRFEGRALQESTAAAPVLEGHLARIRELSGKARRLSDRTSALARLAPPPVLAPCAALSGRLAALSVVRDRTASARATLSRLVSLAEPPRIGNAAPLAGVVAQMRRLRDLKDQAAQRLAALESLAAPPAVSDPSPLAGLVASMETLSARLAKGRAWLAERDTALADLAEAISRRLAEVGECPLCGAGLDAGRFLTKAGGRGTS